MKERHLLCSGRHHGHGGLENRVAPRTGERRIDGFLSTCSLRGLDMPRRERSAARADGMSVASDNAMAKAEVTLVPPQRW